MLNIGKLAPGGESYYLDTVASGVEDYYTGSGEAPGRWAGAAAATLGLSGRVAPEALRAVLGAVDPASGELLTGRMSRRSVPGFDCTFRAPKSVSLLYGLADVDTAVAVRDAHDAAVLAALSYLEAHAGFSRRGHGGVERTPVEGFVATAFRHRTSRAGDPLLHTHVLVANLGQAIDDGAWRTLDGRSLYQHAKTAGYLYQAHLRAELGRRLGVGWGPVVNGCADIAGVPKQVITAFSQRRSDILDHMAARGESSAKAAQVATLATRKAKQRTVEPAALGAEWSTRAAALGFGPEEVAALTGPASPTLDPHRSEGAGLTRTAQLLLGAGGLTAHASTFTRRDVIRAWCDQLPAGADTAEILALADAVLADADVVALDGAQADARGLTGDRVIRRRDGRIVPAEPDERRYSTVELLAVEQRATAGALARRDAAVALAHPEKVEAALAARPSIAGEQAAMVRVLTGSGAGVQVVVGKAGAGKTFALDAARAAWQASGIPVTGCALAARAAAELRAGAGIDSATIDAVLADLDHPRHGGLIPGSVVVVDEAGMVGTRTLSRLLDHAKAAAAKVVLVGDHHQLPEIDAGGLFRSLGARLGAVELLDNRRQHQPWERDALDELRDGDPGAALAAYSANGRIVLGDSAEQVRDRLVADWWDARIRQPDAGGVMIAARRSDVADLNMRARTRMAAAGRLTGAIATTSGGGAFQTGDEIVCLRNDRRLGVINGTRGTITAVDSDAQSVTVATDADVTVTLGRDYLDAGYLGHGYAITGHKAQGMTVDRAWVLGSDAVYREWGYVALSRGRASNRLYIVTSGDDGLDAEELHAHGPTGATVADPVAALARALERDRAQHLASDQTTADIDCTSVDGHVADAPSMLPRRSAAAAGANTRLARLCAQRDAAVEHLTAAQRRLDAADAPARRSGGLRRLLPRADRAGAGRVEVTRLRGDHAAWAARVAELDATIDALTPDTHQESHDPPARENPESDDLQGFDAVAVRSAVEAAELDPPEHLLEAVGPYPDGPAARRTWRHAVQAVEGYRVRWQLTSDDTALGGPPAGTEQQRHRAEVSAVLVAARDHLAVDNRELGRRAPDGQSNDRGIGIG